MPQPKPATLLSYATLVVQVGLTSFGGGISAWMMRLVVEDRGWMSEGEFLSGLAICQVLPGVNVVNLMIWLGFRLHGGLGAVVGVFALCLPPAFVLIGLSTAFGSIAGQPTAKAALTGVAAAAVGLTGAMGLRALQQVATGAIPVLLALATFVTVGLLQWPMLPVVVALAIIGITLAALGY